MVGKERGGGETVNKYKKKIKKIRTRKIRSRKIKARSGTIRTRTKTEPRSENNNKN